MALRWLTAFLDRPAEDFAAAAEFWAAITGTELSPLRGFDGEFATLEPASGDAYLRVQRVVTGGGSHLDVHVADVMPTVARAEELGAGVEHELGGVPVMRSPAGFPFCVASDQGESAVPAPTSLEPGGPRVLVDTLCIDIPAGSYDAECRFWSAFTGWDLKPTKYDEYSYLVRPDGIPLRLLLQRLGASSAAVVATAHLDLACDDVDETVAAHKRLGARVIRAFEQWTVMNDPGGYPYCLIRRPPPGRPHP